MREKNKIKIVLSLLIAVSFMLPVSSVIGGSTTGKVEASASKVTTNRQLTAEIFNPSGDGGIIPLGTTVTFPVGVTAISLNGINHKTNDIVATGIYSLDVRVNRTDPTHDTCAATVKKFIEVFQKKIIPGTPPTTKDLYCENFENPCEIALNWSTLDMPVPGYNGALDTWTWSSKRSCSPGHSMHSTSFETYLASQYDILELGFGGAGINVLPYSTINITWCQFIQGDAINTGNGTIIIQDYGMFEYSFDDISWTSAGVKYYSSNGVTQTIALNIPTGGHATMYFRWTFKSDPTFCYEGWYIDDVCLKGLIGGTPDITTWVFLMDSHSYPQTFQTPSETYVFNESVNLAQEGTYRICAWIEALDECHYSITDWDSKYCIYITVGNILDLSLNCVLYSITPPSPAFEGDTVNATVKMCNVGTLNAKDAQVEMLVQRGTFDTVWTDTIEGTNNVTTGLLNACPSYFFSPETDPQWMKSSIANRGWEHYTTYDKTVGTKSIANFKEIGVQPWDYHALPASNSDWLRSPLLWKGTDTTTGIKVTFDLKYNYGTAADGVRVCIWDWTGGSTGSHYTYGFTLYGPDFSNWYQETIPVSDWIKALVALGPVYGRPTDTFCVALISYDYGGTPKGDPACPWTAQWSGFMMDNVQATALVAQPAIIFSQTQIVPYLNITQCTDVKFSWPDAGVGRYVITTKILTADAVASNNMCIQAYNVINMIIPPDDLVCVDYTGPGQGHWIEEGCCGGYFWCGDPVTTLYGNNWSDALYLTNATGSITFDMTGHPVINWIYSTWFQMNPNDLGLVQYSLDKGITWVTVASWTGNSAAVMGADAFGWFNDIHGIPTSATMQMRYLFKSNASQVNRGWIIDNVNVQDASTSANLFGPDPCLNFNHFYRHVQQYGCWWNTPDQYAYTPGYGCFDPAFPAHSPAAFVGMYPDNLDCALIWTLNIPHAFYGYLNGYLEADLEAGDIAYMDVSNDSGATWNNLETMGTGWYFYPGPWDLATYMDTQLQIRWRMTSDGANAGIHQGPLWEDMNFYGMEDVNPPVTTLAMSGTFDEGFHYYTSAVKMKLTATDDVTGVAHTYYKLDGVTHEYTGLVTISTDGTHTFCYWSVDKENNVETEKCVLPFRIDLTGPSVTITGPATGALYLFGSHILDLKSGKTIFLFGGIPVTATATASDAPILVVRFFLDDVLLAEDSTAPYGATLSAKHSGPAVIVVKAVDVLGHEAVSAPLNIDNYVKII